MAEDYARALELLEQVGPAATPRGAHAVLQSATLMAVWLAYPHRAATPLAAKDRVYAYVLAPLVLEEVGRFPGAPGE